MYKNSLYTEGVEGLDIKTAAHTFLRVGREISELYQIPAGEYHITVWESLPLRALPPSPFSVGVGA